MSDYRHNLSPCPRCGRPNWLCSIELCPGMELADLAELGRLFAFERDEAAGADELLRVQGSCAEPTNES